MRTLLLGWTAVAALSAAPLVTTALMAEEDDLFGKLDANKDGLVTADEVQGDGKAKIERLLRTSDKDGDKKLSKEEFAAGLKEPDQPKQPLAQGAAGRPGGGQFNPREMFARMDANKDGKISKDEARGPFQENFERIDANHDGSLSEDELGRRPGAPGFGNPPDARQWEAVFDRTDANSDGKVVKDEMPDQLRERFGQFLERQEIESVNKEQFGRFMAMAVLQSRPPLYLALDADNDGELSAAEIEGASKALLKLDRNSDGKLTREELGSGGPGRPGEGRPGDGRPPEGRPAAGRGRFDLEQFQARIKEADKDKDGKLSKEELQNGELPPALKERFDRIDANSDGQIDQEELKQMAQRMRQGRGDRPRRPEGQRRPEGERRPDAPRPEAK